MDREKMDLEVQRLRGLNISWADISRRLGKPQHVVQDRFYKRRKRLKRKPHDQSPYSVPKSDNEAVRTCLRCGNPFVSFGPGNRRCNPCQNELNSSRECCGLDVRYG